MKKIKILHFVILVVFTAFLGACSTNKDLGEPKSVNIIPKPVEIVELGKNYEIAKSTTIYTNSESEEVKYVADYLKNRIEKANSGAKITIKNEKSEDKGIHLVLNEKYNKDLGEEGYTLSSDDNIVISANKPAGLFYGVQTLFQLLPEQIYSTSSSAFDMILPGVKIKDKPRFTYRGLHLDPCRNFFSVETTKKYLDYMAYHKLNKFHWHLTEDQGWRIQIKKHPKLTDIGAKRKGTIILNHNIGWDDNKYDNVPVEDYYTQEQIKEIVKYAKERFIEVIPEIEMPGHSLGALAAYPKLSCTGGPFEVMQKWGVSSDVFCAGNDDVFKLLEDVIDEVVELFPSKYIHIGGDECPKDRWKKCKKCQKRIKDNKLANEHELKSWFIRKMEKYINSKGKILIGWSEIMEGGIAPNAVLESWLGTKRGVEAAKQKHKVIMSPNQYIYFDGIHVDKEHRKMEPYGQTYCWTNSEKIYGYEILPDTVPTDIHKFFLGAEGPMWSEYISTEKHLEYMLMPRVSALSEICWTEKNAKNFKDFKDRMNQQYLRYDQMNVNYRVPHTPMPDTINITKGGKVKIINPTEVTEVRYTLDGSEPTAKSEKYTKPLDISKNTVLKTKAFNKKGRGSSIFKTSIIVK